MAAINYDREGGDITAADMVLPEEIPSQIAEFYSNSTIFITGATGFLGKLFLEKLLRVREDLKRVYVLVRQKKGKEEQERYGEIFSGPNFDPLKRMFPNFMQKITMVCGDCSLPDLGLSSADKNTLISEVNCVIHCAATVRFDQKLKTAAYINVRSVRDLLEMAKKMKNLKSFLHVSTAYSNLPDRVVIGETFYPPPISSEKLLTLVETLPDSKLEEITETLVGSYHNTYIYTKCVSEDLIKNEGRNLPICVLRPSIVIASLKEPVAGWIDNYYGATGVLVGAALGVIRTLYGKKNNSADLIPADYTVNCGLACLWEVATKKSLNFNKEFGSYSTEQDQEVPVYNVVSYPEAKITWAEFMKLAETHAPNVPTTLQVWRYFFAIHSCKVAYNLTLFFYHTVPAYLVDFVLLCLGKEPMMVQNYKKIHKFLTVLSDFSHSEWHFSNDNVQKLWLKMSERDKESFEFSMKNFDWNNYFHTYVRGARVYLLKDPLETLPQGTVKYYKLMAAHYTLVAFVFYVIYRIVLFLFGLVFF